MESIWQVLVEEFSDVPSISHVLRICLRLGLAAVLGGLLGYEREAAGKSAGIRTHMLVALGAAVFVLIPQQAGVGPNDLSRVIQGLVAGIGFIGAGTIMRGAGVDDVRGLTTAAGLWLTAAIGVAAGMGRESTAILSTLIALMIFLVIPRLFRWNKKPIDANEVQASAVKENGNNSAGTTQTQGS
jgi:putative Mg2+ transporter-C (MgtC) family protein